MAGWHHWLDGCEFEWTPGVGDGQGGLVCCDSWGRKESDTTERLNWAELIQWFSVYSQNSRTNTTNSKTLHYSLQDFGYYPLSHMAFANIFSHSVGWFGYICLFLLLLPLTEKSDPKYTVKINMKEILIKKTQSFLLWVLIVSGLTFTSFIHFEFTFVHGLRNGLVSFFYM